MSAQIECRKCGSDLEQWNNRQNLWITYCPHCGVKVLKKQRLMLYKKTTIDEIDRIIRGHVLDVLDTTHGMDISADELADRAFETENCDGVLLYSNYEADCFVFRHSEWVDEALDSIGEILGDYETYAKMRNECNDRFLVVACIFAARQYLYCQLGIDQDEGDLSARRITEIKRLVKATEYNGGF
jgi:DNA-directed RNA polymerase subunit RPC12/RpoP